jgi:hypothetical protein
MFNCSVSGFWPPAWTLAEALENIEPLWVVLPLEGLPLEGLPWEGLLFSVSAGLSAVFTVILRNSILGGRLWAAGGAARRCSPERKVRERWA